MKSDAKIIDELGGTFKVAHICQIKPPSVSAWKKDGIPPARRQFLALLRPDVFGQPNAAIPTASAHALNEQTAGGV